MRLIPKKVTHKLWLNIILITVGMLLSILTSYYGIMKISKEFIKSLLKAHLDTVYNTVDFIHRNHEVEIRKKMKIYLNRLGNELLRQIEDIYSQYTKGEKTIDEIKQEIFDYCSKQKYGKTGYPVIWDRNAIYIWHPHKQVIGKDGKKLSLAWLAKDIVKWVKDKDRNAIGKIYEYLWRNPGERYAKPKILVPVYFHPLRWIFLITTYRSEILFTAKIKGLDIRNLLRGIKIGKRGYIYIINGRGIVVLHPKYEGKKVSDIGKTVEKIFDYFVKKKYGYIEYEWENSKKIAVFRHFKPLDWYIAISAYYSDLFENKEIYLYVPIIIGIIIVLVALIIMLIQRGQILYPTREIISIIREAEQGNIEMLYPFRQVNCSIITKCNNDKCKYFGSTNSECFYTIGSFAKEYGGTVSEDRMYKDCSFCPVYKMIISSEFDEIGLWISLLLVKLKKMADVLTSLEKISSETSIKLLENSKEIIEMADFLDKEFKNIEDKLNIIREITKKIYNFSFQERQRTHEIIQEIDKIVEDIRVSGEMSHKFTKNFGKLKDVFQEEIAALRKTVEYMVSLKKDYERIREIVKVIKDIASETSLLSLNASIEAARAGERGKGFAVVADEISKLSIQTQESSQEISELIEESVEKGLSGIKNVEKLEQKLKEILDQTSDMVDTIIPIFNKNIQNAENVAVMRDVIKEIGEIFNTIAKYVANQNDQADNLIELVHNFRNKISNLRKISQNLGKTSSVVSETSNEFNAILEFFGIKRKNSQKHTESKPK